jgi:branched-chain amino acid transport system substrate-binding protein
MKKKVGHLFLTTFLLLTFVFPACAWAETSPAAPAVLRLAGDDRYLTAAAIARDGWSTSAYAILAYGQNYPDALSAVPLAQKYDAPILLTPAQALPDATKQALTDLKVKNVLIVGGNDVITAAVESELRSLGLTVTRFAGADRYETAIKIAEQLASPATLFVATGEDYSDALSVGPIAAAEQAPVILVPGTYLPDAVKGYLAAGSAAKTYFVGDAGVIADSVYQQFPNPVRLTGSDKYARNIAVNQQFDSGFATGSICLATGEGFADALTGAAYAAQLKAPVVLTGSTPAAVTKDYYQAKVKVAKNIYVFGGTGVLAASVLNDLAGPNTGSPAGAIKIGALLELTGPLAAYGQAGLNGMQLALDRQNAAGGVLGRKLTLIQADNQSDAAESAVQAGKLAARDQVIAILGPMASSGTLAALPAATQNKLPLITPTASNPALTVNADGTLNPWIFRACFSDPFQGTLGADFAVRTLKAGSAAIITDQGSDYSQGLAQAFAAEFTKNGGKIAVKEQYTGGAKDFWPVLNKVKAQNPDLIYLPGYYQEVGLIIKQGRELGLSQPFLGGDAWNAGNLAAIAGIGNLNGTYYIDHTAAGDPIFQDFSQTYQAKFGSDADAFAALGYDAAGMLIQAIRNAGSTDTEKIRQALENLQGYSGVSGIISVDPQTHNLRKSGAVIQYKDGKMSFLTRLDPMD